MQDLYSNSSLLKSFGKEEELNLLNFYANANVASTPALGSNDNILYSHASSGAKGNSGQSSVGKDGFTMQPPFASTKNSNENTTSTFKIQKNEEILQTHYETTKNKKRPAFDRCQEIINSDTTPDKGEDNLLKLLSSLDGLTPAGLEHLMET